MEKDFDKFPKRFDHKLEGEIYKEWERSGVFKPGKTGKPFCITMPPPNVTGDLHMGHALTNAIQDTIARNRRRRGYSVLLLPGFDHAAIAVQNLVEKKLSKDGKRASELGREEFLKEVWQWVDYYMPRVKESTKKFGVSCDWDSCRFTMDENYQKSVAEAFKQLYDKGLIYRDQYLVNWDTKLRTAISDEELEYQEVPGKLYFIKYGEITVATTRPETKLGDTAIAVNPKDSRYKKFVGKEIEFTNELGEKQKLPVIDDEVVDAEFGTGALKVTPAHDPTDWLIGKKHKLEFKQVIGTDGKIVEGFEPYSGLKISEAREKIVADLQRHNLIEKITDYKIRQPIGDRSGSVIEPLPSIQWFLKTTALVDDAIKAVKSGEIEFTPKSLEKVYIHWLENLHDWCISRQIWWGHRLPVWYKSGEEKKLDGEIIISSTCPKDGFVQESDVLDTWFSSGLWPFATLGWPEKTKKLDTYFPTDLMETGTDILFFWVVRMIFMSQALTGKIPFKKVLFHGLILDETGKKMSKSKGNVTDPLQIIDLYGADALRMGLIGQNAVGVPQKYSDEKIKKYRNFVTKIWNASRFVKIVCDGDLAKDIKPSSAEKEFLDKLDQLEKDVEKFQDKYQLNLALEALYEFFWHEFCDSFIEEQKKIISDQPNSKQAESAKVVLTDSLKRLLAMIGDFAPFVVYQINKEILDA